LIGFLAFVARTPSLSGEFIWDDGFLARDSPFIKSPLLALEVFRQRLFPDSFAAHYRPVQNLSFMVDYFFWNTNSFGFHLTNLLLHAASAVALFFLLQRLFLDAFKTEVPNRSSRLPENLALFAALIWALHPVHSAAVDYISGRADSLAFLLAATAWLFVLKARQLTHPWQKHFLYFTAALLGLLALCSRETACIWLLLFSLHTLFFNPDLTRQKKFWALLSCVTLFAVYLGLRHLPPPPSSSGPGENWNAPMRAVLMLRALGDYGRLLVLPSNLHMERSLVNGASYSNRLAWESSIATEYLSLAGLFVVAILLGGCIWRSRGQSLRIFGAGWFLVSYLPISNIVELNATCAEHWLYLPSVGVLIFLAGCALNLPERVRPFLFVLGCLAVSALGLRSAIRSSDWVTPQVFYERTIAAGGDSLRVSENLAELYARQGERARAEALLRRILVTTPDFPTARNCLARVLFEEGRRKESEALFAASAKQSAETAKIYPRTWVAALNLAQLQHYAHRDAEALATLEKARANYPETWELVSLESELLSLTKRPGSGLQLVFDFAQRHWWHYGAALALGRLYAQTGDVERADAVLRKASWLDVHEVDALDLIAQMRLGQHRFAEACRIQRSAIARQPDAPRQYALLSDILSRMGEPAEAKIAMAEVTRLSNLDRSGSPFVN
jgi:tetratricopeptide (TPR) repeat protein